MMYKIICVLLMLTINNTYSYESTIKPIKCPKYCECNEIIINKHPLFHNQLGGVGGSDSTQLINTKSKHNRNSMLNVKCINTEYLIKLQNKNVYKLDLSNQNIKKFNLNIINNLYNLHILNISHNAIVDLSISITLTQLTHVYLQNNNISTISYSFLPQSIKYIDISYNNLNYIPENFNNLFKLQYINLFGNRLLCTCFNYISINNLLKRLIIVDYNAYCNDALIKWDQFNKDVKCIEGHGTQYLNDAEGSGDVESTVDSIDQQLKTQDLDNMIELSNNGGKLEDDDLNEFIPVISTESTISKSTTMKNDDLIIGGDKRMADFYFNDTSNTSHDEEEESGSGDDQLILSSSTNDYSDDLIVPSVNMTEDASQPTVDVFTESSTDDNQTEEIVGEDDNDDDDYGSGSGSGAIDPSEFDYDFIGSSSSSTTESEGSSSTTEAAEVPIIFVNEVSTTTTTEATPSPSTEATSSTQATSTSTSTESPKIVTEPPIIKVERKMNSEVERVLTSGNGSMDNINEELGQVVKEANTSPSMGTYAFLTILVVVLIALIGYTVIKRRVNHQNQHNNNNQHLSTGRARNGGTTDATGNNGLKKKSKDDVDNDKYAHEMTDMRPGDDDKVVALLNQENETKRKPNNGTVVNEKSPMMNNPDEGYMDTPLSIPTPTTSADTQPPPTPSPRNLDSAAGNGAVEKVKITMTELTDSIPKTPVLVTRTKSFTKDGPQIIVTPNLNQRPNV
ncbi:protein windpipe [Chrysoperla carnea]|uniref:protein windpipe n=1 Tax=Chrysoperla carnea TaxID=189513 RepID=UPI001D0694D0|nr:protein windpipe [Chrysoperla carnea]XP_044741569.1 protein windpipe [Chrysoperla carnea]XP_044741570.1 protein windpipe [Chrysoperla carnea]